MEQGKRINLVSLVVGGRGTGKTTLIKKIIRAYLRNSLKVLVIDTFDNPVWSEYRLINLKQLSRLRNEARGVFRVFDTEANNVIEVIHNRVFNGLLIFEDASKYVGSRLNPFLKALVVDSKQKNLDMIFVFHAWGGIVPPDLIRFADTATLFKTNERIKTLAKIPNPVIIEAHEQVMKHPSKFHNVTIKIS